MTEAWLCASGNGTGTLFDQRNQASTAASHWQLLQIAPTGSPGVLKVRNSLLLSCPTCGDRVSC